MVGVDEIIAERQRRKRLRPFPGGAEGRRHDVAAGEPQALAVRFEATATESAERHALAVAKDHQVDLPVAVDVDGVRPEDRAELDDGIVDRHERQRAADGTRVSIEGGRPRPARDIQVGSPIVVAVEDGHAAADREGVLAGVRVIDPRGRGLVDEVGGRQRRGRRGSRSPHKDEPTDDRDDNQCPDCSRDRSRPGAHGLTNATSRGSTSVELNRP